jgi:hypothetical protein
MLFSRKTYDCRAGGQRIALVLVAACAMGCPDPQAEFDDFASRELETRPPPIPAACGTAATEVEGKFIWALAAKLNPKKPILFLNDITTEGDGLHFSITPIDAKDRKTPIGEPMALSAYPIDGAGNFKADFPEMTVPGAANPLTGSDIVATVSLAGAVCTDALCGDVTGTVTEPLMLDLAGSTFYMERVDEDPLPEQPIRNCANEVADPL